MRCSEPGHRATVPIDASRGPGRWVVRRHLRAQRANPKSRRDDMRVAPDKRSAVRGNEVMNIPSFHGPPRQPAGWRGGPWKEGVVVRAGCPGRQSLRSFALGYFLLAPPGWQIEPPDVG